MISSLRTESYYRPSSSKVSVKATNEPACLALCNLLGTIRFGAHPASNKKTRIFNERLGGKLLDRQNLKTNRQSE